MAQLVTSIRQFMLLAMLLLCPAAEAKLPIVLWDTLFLIESPKVEDKAKVLALEKQDFRIPGFMIPLESNPKESKEFLLVPSLPACQHVPPPPPNQTIHVTMKAGKTAPIAWDPIWVEGRLKVKKSTIKDFGDASFEMEATEVRVLKQEDMNEIRKVLPPPQPYVPDCAGRDKSDPMCTVPGKGKTKGKPTN